MMPNLITSKQEVRGNNEIDLKKVEKNNFEKKFT